jgi:hypothetical protein
MMAQLLQKLYDRAETLGVAVVHCNRYGVVEQIYFRWVVGDLEAKLIDLFAHIIINDQIVYLLMIINY